MKFRILFAMIFLTFFFSGGVSGFAKSPDAAGQGKAKDVTPYVADDTGSKDDEFEWDSLAEDSTDEAMEDSAAKSTEPENPSAMMTASGEGSAAASAWDEYTPGVEVSKWGQEIRIVFNPAKTMDPKKLAAIQSVKLETPDGEFLGLKTYSASEETRTAEFMINPELIKLDKVKVVASSTADGDWSKMVSLEEAGKKAEEKSKEAGNVSEGGASGAPSPAAAPVPKPEQTQPSPDDQASPKKKGWLW